MYVCPNCAASFDRTRFGSDRQTCPDCGATMPLQADRPWTDVARVRNLAEAGFLTDELIGLGIDARIHQLDEYNAINNRWAALYMIRVPSPAASEAADHIRTHLAEDEAGEPEPAAFALAAHDHDADPLLWRPVAIVVLAGMASFVLGQRFSGQKEHRPERRPPRNSLAAAIEAIDRPLLTEPQAGRPRHRLSFDRLREAWLLDIDRDADGLYESRQVFHTSGAAW
jgi:hypothetical protein